ncbi:hypothetical protein BDV36DRAFT_12421 [Aspergillus pseudocaelatus]|uniref:Uncharacterized protein n=1 Tax=Aspergillus pseudocaelatus TaxID=1825620 RepID=A0ABQ6WAT0_9EURO|nr:hypothetical protein BDV36DRAFT_12421 [Aspergillus pseudocaelatus]
MNPGLPSNWLSVVLVARSISFYDLRLPLNTSNFLALGDVLRLQLPSPPLCRTGRKERKGRRTRERKKERIEWNKQIKGKGRKESLSIEVDNRKKFGRSGGWRAQEKRMFSVTGDNRLRRLTLRRRDSAFAFLAQKPSPRSHSFPLGRLLPPSVNS